MYELVHGRAPFTGVHPREISDKIMKGVIRFKPGVTAEYKDLVKSILKYDTTERIPLIKVFDHPWVTNFQKKYNLTKAPAPKKQLNPEPSTARSAIKRLTSISPRPSGTWLRPSLCRFSGISSNNCSIDSTPLCQAFL